MSELDKKPGTGIDKAQASASEITKLSESSFFKQLLGDRKSTRLNSSHIPLSRMPSSA